MSYFPAFIKLDNKKILIVGGGKIAGEKLQKLLDFTDDITLIASEFLAETMQLASKHSLQTLKKSYKEGDIDGFDIVIVTVDDIEVQKSIYKECQAKRILCNSVDSVAYCDFIFPSYTKKGDLTIAYSTSGISPSFAKYLRRTMEQLIPDSVNDFLAQMQKLRKELPKGKERMQLLDAKAKQYVESLFKKEKNVQ
ncbi:Siroheme synthase / Precorrin-2 oxidase / Sirohydrochlorin ferrochelatase [hydrothermal vent metagenome]|uniref:precorrin-2 dehydrogenase n=1 Tax=hydrothermal vent metagenome TaxID=652676 RepID=A0A1W1BU39_9ZZZZ